MTPSRVRASELRQVVGEPPHRRLRHTTTRSPRTAHEPLFFRKKEYALRAIFAESSVLSLE